MGINKTNRHLKPELVNNVFADMMDQQGHVSMQALATELSVRGLMGSSGRPFSRQSVYIVLRDSRNTPGNRLLERNKELRRAGAFAAVEGK